MHYTWTCVYCRLQILCAKMLLASAYICSVYTNTGRIRMSLFSIFISTPSSLFHTHEELNWPTLFFKKWRLNRQFALQPDKEFKFYLSCVLLLFVVIYLTQAIMLTKYVHYNTVIDPLWEKGHLGIIMAWMWRILLSGFSPHWLGVVGSNHHSVIFTTTQACFTATHRGKKCWNLCLKHFDSTLAKV